MNDLLNDAKTTEKVYFHSLNVYKEYDIVELRKRVGMVFQKPNPFPMESRWQVVVRYKLL